MAALARSALILGLDKVETGFLFGITRQGVDRWHKRDIPTDRVADVESVAEIASALHARFTPERIHQIVRQPLPGLSGRNILDAIRAGSFASILNMLNRAFSYMPDDGS
jgi:hypothetical protein